MEVSLSSSASLSGCSVWPLALSRRSACMPDGPHARRTQAPMSYAPACASTTRQLLAIPAASAGAGGTGRASWVGASADHRRGQPCTGTNNPRSIHASGKVVRSNGSSSWCLVLNTAHFPCAASAQPLAFLEAYFLAFGSAASKLVPRAAAAYFASGLNFMVISTRDPSLLTMPIRRSRVKRLRSHFRMREKSAAAMPVRSWLYFRQPGALRALAGEWRMSLSAGVLGTIASVGWLTSVALHNAAEVRALGLIEVFFSYAVSRKLLDEKVSGTEIVGGILIMVGVVLICLRVMLGSRPTSSFD